VQRVRGVVNVVEIEIGTRKAVVIDIDCCRPEAAVFVRTGAPLLQMNNDVVAVAC
jgi:hypothetical protein